MSDLSHLTEQGIVVNVQDGAVIVEVVRTSACQSCKARQGCGQAVLSEWGDSEKQSAKNHFRIASDKKAQVGDIAVLSMAHDTVTKVAMLVYVLPLFVSFLGLLLGYLLNATEAMQLVLFLSFFFFSFFLIRATGWAKSPALVPKILRLSSPSKAAEIIESTEIQSV
jgi:sigma-E factor negative regulatory protein RseC